jgi:hypothetical protein
MNLCGLGGRKIIFSKLKVHRAITLKGMTRFMGKYINIMRGAIEIREYKR